MNDYEEIIHRLERIETRLCKFIEAMGYNPSNINAKRGSQVEARHLTNNTEHLDECECNAMTGASNESGC